jgi:hypothetical protein
MKRLTGFLISAVAMSALVIPSVASANASNLRPGGPTGTTIGTSQGGKNMQTTQYKAVYTDPVMGPVSCAGVHQVSKAAVQDSWTCASTTASPLTGVSAGQSITTANFGWNSDFNGAGATSLAMTVSADGLSETGVATY